MYVQPFPVPAHATVSTAGAPRIVARDARELLHDHTNSWRTGDSTKMMVVPVTFGPTFSAGAPRMLFEGRYGATAAIRGYDVTPDGRRFLMVRQKERPAVSVSEMVLVQNWFEELKARVPVK